MGLIVAAALILVVTVVTVSNERCPDRTTCPSDSSTCCPSPAGRGFNCCPLQHAVCCEGGLYCCPSGTTCNSKNGTCDVAWSSRYESRPMRRVRHDLDSSTNDICPDKKHECSDESTCCATSSHEFGCCPYQHAVCCSDDEHCCPQGTSCDLAHGKCDTGMTRVQTQRLNSTRVLCPDRKFQCADGSTCCELDTGYGCCPLEKAVCCSDRVHCCPDGYSCAESGCQKSPFFTSSLSPIRR